MHSTDGAADQALRQFRLSRFGLALAVMSLGFVAANFLLSLWLGQLSFNRHSVLLLVASAAFAVLWLLMRGAPRSPQFVRTVELLTLFVGTAAFSATALVMDMLANPDMFVRTLLTYMLLVYAVYVPSTARHTLLVARADDATAPWQYLSRVPRLGPRPARSACRALAQRAGR